VMNPRQVRDLAKATGQLAKTAGLDARAVAHWAEAVRPAPRPPGAAAAPHCDADYRTAPS
jgi:transposase